MKYNQADGFWYHKPGYSAILQYQYQPEDQEWVDGWRGEGTDITGEKEGGYTYVGDTYYIVYEYPLDWVVLADTEAEIVGLNYHVDNIYIPSKIFGYDVVSIGDHAFDSWTGYDFYLPSSVVNVGADTFNNCANLSISWDYNPDLSITSFKDYLTEVLFRYWTTEIPANAFENCISLTSISIPETITKIGADAFKGSGLWNAVTDDVVYADKWAVGYNGTLSCVSLTVGTFGIADFAFANSDITGITFPASLVYLGQDAFYKCFGLGSISVNSYNQQFASSKGILFDKWCDTIVFVPLALNIANNIDPGLEFDFMSWTSSPDFYAFYFAPSQTKTYFFSFTQGNRIWFQPMIMIFDTFTGEFVHCTWDINVVALDFYENSKYLVIVQAITYDLERQIDLKIIDDYGDLHEITDEVFYEIDEIVVEDYVDVFISFGVNWDNWGMGSYMLQLCASYDVYYEIYSNSGGGSNTYLPYNCYRFYAYGGSDVILLVRIYNNGQDPEEVKLVVITNPIYTFFGYSINWYDGTEFEFSTEEKWWWVDGQLYMLLFSPEESGSYLFEFESQEEMELCVWIIDITDGEWTTSDYIAAGYNTSFTAPLVEGRTYLIAFSTGLCPNYGGIVTLNVSLTF